MKTPLSVDQLKQQYPDEWLLLGDPEFANTHPLAGVLLAHSHDYLELCYQSSDLTKGVANSTIIYTGQPKTQNRQWLRAIRLNEPPKTA